MITAKQLHPISGRPICRVRVMSSHKGTIQVMALDGSRKGTYYTVLPDDLQIEQDRSMRSRRSRLS